MYSKEQASKIRTKFWTIFGQYMKPVPGASGEAVNWINYKTSVKSIYFRMDAGKDHATISLEIKHPDSIERAGVFDQFVALKNLLEKTTMQNWTWQTSYTGQDDEPISRIFLEQENVNIFNEATWPSIISFLKRGITGLDEFWQQVKYGFE